MNVLLSSDNIVNDNIVTCPFNRTRFDITTGTKIKDPSTGTFARNGITTKNLAKVFGTCRITNGSY